MVSWKMTHRSFTIWAGFIGARSAILASAINAWELHMASWLEVILYVFETGSRPAWCHITWQYQAGVSVMGKDNAEHRQNIKSVKKRFRWAAYQIIDA